MYKIFKLIIAVCFATFSFFTIPLYADSCSSPNFDKCSINDEEKVIAVDSEDVNIINSSNMKIGSLIFTKDNLNLSMVSSTLDTNRIIPSSNDYKLNITLDKSFFTFRNAGSITIDNLNIKDDTSIFNVLGLSSVTINNLSSQNNAVVKVKSSFSILSLKKSSINNLYLTSGYLRIKEDENNINNILNVDPTDETKDYTDLNKGGYIEIIDKGTLNVNNLDASSVHVLSGTLNIKGNYNIDTFDNKSSSSVYDEDAKIINIDSTAQGKVTSIDLASLNLKGSISIQNGGNISNLNYSKDSNGNNVSVAEGSLEYNGLKIPDKDGNIKESDPEPSLTLKRVYLNSLILNGGNIKITSEDSTINEITNPSSQGNLKIEYVNNMQSNNVDINSLDLYSTNYHILNSFNAKNLKMGGSSVLTLDCVSALNFDTLELKSYSDIKSSSALSVTINKELNIYNSMLKLDTLNVSNEATLNIGIDGNLIDDDNSRFTSGVSATSTINLNNSKILANIQNTSLFNLKRSYSYNVLHADGGITGGSWQGDINLPSWFSSDFFLSSDNKDLVVNVKRIKSYQELLANSSYAEDENTKNISVILDKMVDNQYFTKNLANVISNIDLKSDINSIGNNLASLKPVDNNVYISDINSIADIYLDILSQNSSSSYLKTKGNSGDVIWVRNGFKLGKYSPENFYDGGEVNSYFVMSGFDLLSVNFNDSYFQLGVAGGFNFSDITAKDNLYDISSSGFNASVYANFITNKLFLSFSSMYINNIYDTSRVPLNSKVTSSGNVAEIVNSIEISSPINFYKSIIFKPGLFYTNGYIMAGAVSEQGGAGFNLPSYNSMVNEAGFKALFYTDLSNSLLKTSWLQGSYNPYLELKSFYRNYKVPNTNINFLNTDGYDINIKGDKKNSAVLKGSLGIDYEKNANVLGIRYSYEYSFNNYSNNQFYLNYKLLLN